MPGVWIWWKIWIRFLCQNTGVRRTWGRRILSLCLIFDSSYERKSALLRFDEFKENELISNVIYRITLGRGVAWWGKTQASESILDDVVFEIELIRQIEINIDYILMLVKKQNFMIPIAKHWAKCCITINKAIDASPELRSKETASLKPLAGESRCGWCHEWMAWVCRNNENMTTNTIITEKNWSRKIRGSSWRMRSVKGEIKQPERT